MGLFDIFAKDPDQLRTIEKLGKRLMNKHHQTAERQSAIDGLARIGTPAAIMVLLKRFQYRTEQSIVDEDEKQLVYDRIVALGDKAVPGIVSYINKESGAYWPVKALRVLAGEDVAAGHVVDAIEAIPHTFGQNRERRQQLVDNLRGFANNDRVYALVKTLLEDEDEEVVVRAVDALSGRDNAPDAPALLLELFLRESTTVRLRMMVLELMAERGWSVGDARDQVKPLLAGAYLLDADGRVTRR